MCVYLRKKFQVSSIILTIFRHGGTVALPPLTSKQTPKKPTQIRVKVDLHIATCPVPTTYTISCIKEYRHFSFLQTPANPQKRCTSRNEVSLKSNNMFKETIK